MVKTKVKLNVNVALHFFFICVTLHPLTFEVIKKQSEYREVLVTFDKKVLSQATEPRYVTQTRIFTEADENKGHVTFHLLYFLALNAAVSILKIK